MKKNIYILGIITLNLLLLGSVFKVNHLPGAGILLTVSLFLLSFVFLPLALINNYKEKKAKKWLYIATFISFLVVFIGALFKTMHWPGAGLILLIGVPIPFLLFLPVYIYFSIKDKQQPVINFTAVILGLTFVAVYSVLLAINVSADILDRGIMLIKSNEATIDFYESQNSKFIDFAANKNDNTQHLDEIVKRTNAIKLLIHQAKDDLLVITENSHLDTDFGNDEFNYKNIYNVDAQDIVKYVLFSKVDAKVPEIEKELKAYVSYLHTLSLNPETIETVDKLSHFEITTITNENYSWAYREFSSDYFVFALESLTRWEKNLRFIEYITLKEIVATKN
jgi:hypothetical protein